MNRLAFLTSILTLGIEGFPPKRFTGIVVKWRSGAVWLLRLAGYTTNSHLLFFVHRSLFSVRYLPIPHGALVKIMLHVSRCSLIMVASGWGGVGNVTRSGRIKRKSSGHFLVKESFFTKGQMTLNDTLL